MDRINGLSDDIICHILSFLPTKQSALTCVLSKRWRNLFALAQDLHLVDDDALEVGCAQSFIDFVDRVLVAPGDAFPIRKLSIKCRKSIDSGQFTCWMFDVLKRGVVNLDIDVIAYKEAILVPVEMFTCRTMVELKLAKRY
ncbi:F-box protein At1g19070 isoform X2 [Capsella rubella]|uniref:F-box protein At1g19070 isoform X2 n=1 Tax=Capsella rubella TaxID=81985 RepID=UPI000CD4E57D|nr:F-box protein At1g19070 isoform X2 [Capsella rubella]